MTELFIHVYATLSPNSVQQLEAVYRGHAIRCSSQGGYCVLGSLPSNVSQLCFITR